MIESDLGPRITSLEALWEVHGRVGKQQVWGQGRSIGRLRYCTVGKDGSRAIQDVDLTDRM